MINTAREDSNQLTKLYRTIYEERCFEMRKREMMENARDEMRTEVERNALTETNQEISLCSSSDLTENISSRYNLTDVSKRSLDRESSDIQIKRNEFDIADTFTTCHKSIETNAYDSYTGSICETSTDKEHAISGDIAYGTEMTETRRHPIQIAKTDGKLKGNAMKHQSRRQNNGELIKRVRERLSFESWKEEKNMMYRRLLREAQEKKQRETMERIREMEYKRATQEAQILKQKEARRSRGMSIRQLQMIQRINTEILQREIEEKRIKNAQAFDAWKRQKDTKSKEARLIESVSYCQLKRSISLTPIIRTEGFSLQFNSWLDQLNKVLHKKYLRERRHLVRSFYCQPTYYGVATIPYAIP